MRTLFLACIAVLIITSSQANACPARLLENTIFFEKTPPSLSSADVIAEVKIKSLFVPKSYKNQKDYINDIKKGVFDHPEPTKAIILKSIKGELKAGEEVTLHYQTSSCGPNIGVDAQGIIIAEFAKNSNDHSVLYPYMRRFGDNRISNYNGSLLDK